MVYKFFDKTSSGSGVAILQNEQLAEELHKPIIKKFKKEEFILHLKTILGGWGGGWGGVGADLADMQLISKFNKGIRFLLCVTDIFRKYARFIPLKDKKKRNYY